VRAHANITARTAGWTATALFVVLSGRTLSYALEPGLSPAGRQLADVTGSPSLFAVTVVATAVASAVAVAVTWLASLAISERQRLEPQAVSVSQSVSALAVTVRSVLLFVASSFGFALLESYVHWRAGLGWHGLHCLLGPVHRDAIPILAALSIVTAAVVKAVAHLFSWMRRVVRSLQNRPRAGGSATTLRRPLLQLVPMRSIGGARLGARGPPPWFSPVLRPEHTGRAL
jgi:hypothetical protein